MTKSLYHIQRSDTLTGGTSASRIGSTSMLGLCQHIPTTWLASDAHVRGSNLYLFFKIIARVMLNAPAEAIKPL
jgi:hypothetical protein